MPRVLAVNNYPTYERFERLVKCLEDNGAHVETIDWSEATGRLFNSKDGVALSGSPDMMSEPRIQAKYQGEIDAILGSSVPVLGVCFGHQMMAHAFGSEVVKDGSHVLDMVKTKVVVDDPLFEGLPKEMMLLESRWEVVRPLPREFQLVARSTASEIAAMRHKSRPLYGVQFHPERYTKENPDGFAVLGNFVRMLR
ncbi:MAG: gamma-glutamyl-gamma-aminobutyrate hydrolase family protein [Nitrososphaerota archaeon]|nr:gamma-glutamyl-gamma-aminobutyrate hydrolase family protein [Nitrososphaerota archaeon]